MDNRIWCVIRPNYNDGRLVNIGIMGTGFFIANDIFITAHHVLNESCFKPNKKYNNTKIFLLNSEGTFLKVDSTSNIEYQKDKDITKIKIKGSYFHFFKTDLNINEQDNVKNLGFPSEKIQEIITQNKNRFVIKKVFEQNGKILKINQNFSSRSIDVNINKKNVVITDYTLQVGYSGGPLLKNDKVIGMMSMKIPENNGIYSKKTVAISCIHF